MKRKRDGPVLLDSLTPSSCARQREAIRGASDAAITVLRVDTIIMAKQSGPRPAASRSPHNFPLCRAHRPRGLRASFPRNSLLTLSLPPPRAGGPDPNRAPGDP
jgi:hypothetical protein